MTATAAKTMAWAPFGHSVTIQKNSTVAIVTNTRTAFTRAGSKSGTVNQAERDPGMCRAGPPRSCRRAVGVTASGPAGLSEPAPPRRMPDTRATDLPPSSSHRLGAVLAGYLRVQCPLPAGAGHSATTPDEQLSTASRIALRTDHLLPPAMPASESAGRRTLRGLRR